MSTLSKHLPQVGLALAVIGAISALAAVGVIAGDVALTVITSVASLVLGGSIAINAGAASKPSSTTTATSTQARPTTVQAVQ